MPTGYVVALAVVVGGLFLARLMFPALPVRRFAVQLTVFDACILGLGVLGLVFHCGAMFFRPVVELLPGAGSAISAIDALGPASIGWYVAPAALVLLGLRRQQPVAVAVLALALVAVGVTMYDGGALPIHLGAIFLAVLTFAAIAATLLLPPHRRPQPTL